MNVRRLEGAAGKRWDDFVLGHSDGTFFHLSGWKEVLARAFGHRTHYLYAESGGKIRGVLPLGQIRSRLFGNALISTPFCVYGGIVAEDGQARDALIAEACGLAEGLQVDYLEIRNLSRTMPDWPCKDLYVTFRKEIDADPEANLKAIPRKQRAMVRKGIKAGLEGELDPDPGRFYDIYSESVRNLGTPVFTRRLFESLKGIFGDHCEVLSVIYEGRAMSSVMSFYFRDEVLPYYGGGIGAARRVAANDFMYWDLMSRAATSGLRVFDFGRSKREVGSYRFKKHWGFEPAPLYYEYHLVRAKEVPDVNPLNPRYRRMVSLWRKLPLKVGQILGPRISKYLG